MEQIKNPILFGHDSRIKLGFIGDEIEKNAIDNANMALLLSIFTHTTIEETKNILKKLLPIVERNGIIIFSMILGNKYSPLGANAYGFKDSYGVVYNTQLQVNQLVKELNVDIELDNVFEADGGYKHSIFKTRKVV